jgi:hypothetical protein
MLCMWILDMLSILSLLALCRKIALKSCVYLQLWIYIVFSLFSIYELFKFICWPNALQFSSVALQCLVVSAINQALDGQNKWKTKIFMFATWRQSLEFIKPSLNSPVQFSEVYLTNELRCAHNHHQIRIKFHTRPFVLGWEKFIKNLLRWIWPTKRHMFIFKFRTEFNFFSLYTWIIMHLHIV